MCVRRAILDAFWSCKASIVRANLREASRLHRIHGGLGIQPPTFPSQSSHPTRDSWGLSAAVGLLVRLLDRGRNAHHVQFDTVQKVQSFAANYTHTNLLGFGPTFTGGDGPTQQITQSATNSFRFSRFMTGCHRQMGDVWKPDRAVNRHVLWVAFRILEE